MSAALSRRTWLGLSLAGTLAILAGVPTSAGKLLALLVLWPLSWRPRLSRREWAVFAGVNALFFVLDGLALQSGAFTFTTADLWGMPLWEPVMWGYYVCWSRRMVDPPTPAADLWLIPLSIALTVPFSLPLSDGLRLALSAPPLLVGLLRFHERYDLAMVLVLIGLGVVVEQTGVRCGLWRYASEPALGVPLWFFTMWGSVGLLARRLLPLIEGLFFAPARAQEVQS